MNEKKEFVTLDMDALDEANGGLSCENWFALGGGIAGAGATAPFGQSWWGGPLGAAIGRSVGEYACNTTGYEYTGQESLWTGAP